ncbi:MAG: integrase core domain-containing protein [Trueperaceae bacterium]
MPKKEAVPDTALPTFETLTKPWQACLSLAWEAYCAGSLPIGAIITDDQGKILARGRNRLAEQHEFSPHLPETPYLTGTSTFPNPDNGADALRTVRAATEAYGVPQQLLSDNSGSFNLSRQGMVTALQRHLATLGCLCISGQFRRPTTQGKNERSHQTLQRFLDAHVPRSVQQVRALLIEYREYYNNRRHHQSLPVEMTPAQAWTAAEHRPSNGTPIPQGNLEARALAYRARANGAPQPAGADVPQEEPQHTGSGRLRTLPDEIVIARQNPQLYLHGKIIKVPTHLVGRYALILSEAEYALFDVRDGAESIRFPLPLETRVLGRYVLLWQVRGARIRDPKPAWTQKHLAYEAEHYPTQSATTSG